MYARLGVLIGVALAAQQAVAVDGPPTLFQDVTVVVLPEGRLVNGRGRFLMPGLTEGHAHVPGPNQKEYAEDVLLLYLAHGLTTIRGMLGDAWHLQLRDRLNRGEALGPRLYTAGPSLNGNSAPTVERAVAMVREQAAAGFDFLKLHPGLKREVFDAIAATASASRITFQGHVSDDVGVVHALAARQRAMKQYGRCDPPATRVMK